MFPPCRTAESLRLEFYWSSAWNQRLAAQPLVSSRPEYRTWECRISSQDHFNVGSALVAQFFSVSFGVYYCFRPPAYPMFCETHPAHVSYSLSSRGSKQEEMMRFKLKGHCHASL